ncbi:hypothetical protein NHQ30_009235 [Ciborinia camelliae]|nr:hypothetical protein NHQ30_009235 [Ciborinia camelliae]
MNPALFLNSFHYKIREKIVEPLIAAVDSRSNGDATHGGDATVRRYIEYVMLNFLLMIGSTFENLYLIIALCILILILPFCLIYTIVLFTIEYALLWGDAFMAELWRMRVQRNCSNFYDQDEIEIWRRRLERTKASRNSTG